MSRAHHPGYGTADPEMGLEMWTTTSNQVWVAAFWGDHRIFAVVPAEEVTVG